MKFLIYVISFIFLTSCALQEGTLADKAQQEAMEAQQKQAETPPPAQAPVPVEQSAPQQQSSNKQPITMTAPIPPQDNIPNLVDTLKEARTLMDENKKPVKTIMPY